MRRLLVELDKLVPLHDKTPGLRDKVKALPWPKELTMDLGDGIKIELVMIRPGSFMMGSAKGGQKPVHKVRISKPCYLGRHEVSQEQWQAVMGSIPTNFKGPKAAVETVSWEDFKTFACKLRKNGGTLQFRLPTEAEWEYACRAGSTTECCYGDDAGGLGEYAWHSSNSGYKTHPAGEKKPNAWGLYDMLGNAWEWCADWLGDYGIGKQENPVGPASGSARVLRGGRWGLTPDGCPCAVRVGSGPGNRGINFGFRVAAGIL